jgi:uncharacterized lipoprotein YmbA
MKRLPWLALGLASLLPGCTSNPDQSVYVMPAPTSLNAASPVASGSLVVKLRPVILPDYLDTTDLVTRTGLHGVEASRTGRWAERLSKGVTRSLAADLGDRLHATIVTDGPIEAPTVEIEVTVNAFDVTQATSVLAASWTIIGDGDDHKPISRHGAFTTSIAPSGGDLAVVAAMTDTVAQLSDAIAATARADH